MRVVDRPAPARPSFATVDEERQHRKARLAATFRLFGHFGFDEGLAGHVTVRDPELSDHYWVNPLGMSFKRIRVRDLHLVDPSGAVVEGTWPVNNAAIALHSRIHEARADVVAAAHTHSVHGKTFSVLHRPLLPITQDACAFHGDHALLTEYGGVVIQDEGERVAAALGPHKAAILANHGLLTVGQSIDECAWWFITMERSCQVQLAAMAAGELHAIDDDVAREVATQVGSARVGWLSFQPLYDWITSSQPDLLET